MRSNIIVRNLMRAGNDGSIDRLRQERDLYRRLLDLGQQADLEPFLEEALALIVDVTGAAQGFLELRDHETESSWSIHHGFSADQVEGVRAAISRGIVSEALATGTTIVTHAALLDERFRSRASVQNAQIDAVLCAPIGGDAALGVVYLQGRQRDGTFTPEDEERAETLALHLAPLAERLVVRRRTSEAEDATRGLRERYVIDGVVGQSAALARALDQALLAAGVEVNVLLTGDSGTGKSQLARVIHDNGPRRTGPFVELNCATLPQNLIESELFGAKKGSHSEARQDVEGKVAAASGGTLFLDEIGELAYEAQAKLLQLLQSKKYYPLGATEPTQADIRLIAATNLDLEDAVAEKRFREDLFYRLQVLPVRVPTLAERSEDVPHLARALCERLAQRYGFDPPELSPGALRALSSADWPGNIRQLENTLEAAVIRANAQGSRIVSADHVFPGTAAGIDGSEDDRTFQGATRCFQRDLLARTLREVDWNVSEAARRLDLARSHVYKLIKAFGLERS
jgi:Nif-specific regulatory protein